MKMLIMLLILFIGSLVMPPGNVVQADNPDQVTIVADVGHQTPAIIAQDAPVFAVLPLYVEKCMLISLPAMIQEKALKQPQAIRVNNDYTNYTRARRLLIVVTHQGNKAQTGIDRIRADTKTV
ncbi:MAG: hypothetical protein AB2L20_14950 [Mangrovibacterium sp.]